MNWYRAQSQDRPGEPPPVPNVPEVSDTCRANVQPRTIAMRLVNVSTRRGCLELHSIAAGSQHPRAQQVDEEVEPLVELLDCLAASLVDETDAILAAILNRGEYGKASVDHEDGTDEDELNAEGLATA